MRKGITNAKKNTMANRLFIPMLLIVCAYAVVFLGTMWGLGVFGQLKDNEVERVRQSVGQKTATIQEKLNTHWEKQDTYQGLFQMCKTAKTNVDAGVQEALMVTGEMAGEVDRIMENQNINGAYVFFDNGAAYYVRKNLEGTKIAEFGEEIFLNEKSIPKSATWRGNTGGNLDLCPGYAEIVEAKGKMPGLSETDYAYFDAGYTVGEDLERAITFSVPLMDASRNVYAVVGVEVAPSALKSLIPNNDIHGTYMLGAKDPEKSFIEKIVFFGENYQEIIDKENGIWLVDKNKDGISEVGSEVASKVPSVISEEITFYQENSAFVDESWILCAIVDEREFTASADKMSQAILTAILCASLVGIIAVYSLSRSFTKPITTLVNCLNGLNPRKSVQLPKVNIYEVDRLSNAIERASKEVENSALRVADVLRIAGIPVGVAEIDEATKEVYCTAKIFSLLGELEPEEGYRVINITEFRKTVEKFKRGTILFEQGEENDEMVFCDNNTYKIYSEKEDAEWISLQTREINGRLIVVVADVTEKIKEKLRLEYERDFDELSRLLNKQAFARETKKRLQTDHHPVGAMIMWDLDNLKYVNDTYGHEYGDMYIRESARVFAYLEQHNGLVARRSGDEFFAYVSGDSEEDLRELIHSIHHMLGEVTIKLPGNKEMKIRASAGIVWCPKDGSEYDDLIRKADFTMYDVKRTVKGSIREFNKETFEQDEVLLTGKGELNEFLEKRLLKIAYQPVVDALTGEVYGYEALMRPQTDTLHSPRDVIKIARAQGKLLELEKVLWEETLKDFFRKHQAENKQRIFINSFPDVALADSDIGDYAQYTPEEYARIVVEMIESDKAEEKAVEKKKECAGMTNSMIAIDDYGVGSSSDKKILQIAPDFVKIDKEIISGIDKDEKKQELVVNMINYLKKQDIMVIAEGVETEAELRFMQKSGADFIQGFYLAKPAFELVEDDSEIKEKIKM